MPKKPDGTRQPAQDVVAKVIEKIDLYEAAMAGKGVELSS